MQTSKLDEQDTENVEVILSCGRHLLNLINDMLDIARIEAGRLGLSLEPVSVEDILIQTCDLIAPIANQKGNPVLMNTSGANDVMVLADQQRLKQILLNYLSNAIKYNSSGVEVSVGYEHRPAGILRLMVADNGVGIPVEKLPLLFSPFERLGAERTIVEGTGLGLAIAKQLAEAMGGSVGVESTVGRGSVFWVDLPETDSKEMELLEHEDHAQTDALQVTNQATFTLLHIEDNPNSLRLVDKILQQRPQVTLLTAHSGLGYELAEQHPVDLILLDLNLPDLSGDEVLRLLLDNPATRKIPVVIMSADASPSTILRLKTAGAYDFLTKPIEVRRFLALIDEFLENHK